MAPASKKRIAGIHSIVILCAALLSADVMAGGCRTANFSYSIDSVNYCNNTICVKFNGYATGLHGDETFCWSWGDGSPQECETPGISGDTWYEKSGCHSFPAGGTYTISLNVTPAHTSCLLSKEIRFDSFSHTKQVSCSGNNDGCVSYDVNPDDPGLTYTWSNGDTGKDVCGLSSGNYTVTITDRNGCSITDQLTVGAPTPVQLVIDNVDCANGDANITVTGGTPHSQNNQPFLENFTGYSDGTTDGGNPVVWTSDNGTGDAFTQWEVINGSWLAQNLTSEAIWKTACIDISNCSNINLSLDAKTDCSDDNDYFRVYYKIDGGQEVLLFNRGKDLYSAGSCPCGTGCSICTNNQCTDPCPANYVNLAAPIPGGKCVEIIIRVRTQTGGAGSVGSCGTSGGSVVTTGGSLVTTGGGITTGTGGGTGESGQKASFGFDNVRVTCSPVVSTPYSYQWCNGETVEDPRNIPAGTGTCCVTVTDGNGCAETECISCCTLDISATKTNVACAGGSDGTGTVTVTTGASPYTYAWSNGRTTSNITGLTAGTYTVTVNGNDGCRRTEIITVTEPPALTRTLTPTHLVCAGAGNGSVSVTAGGGTPGYTYQWSAGGSGSTQSGLSGGTYSVTITDANGCLITGTATVNEPPPLVTSIGPNQTVCPDDAPTSNITLTATGGTPGYTYIWDDPGSGTTATITVTNVLNTTVTYSVTITDANGCTSVEQMTIITACSPVVTLTGDEFCVGNCATLSPQASGGAPPYSYTWSDPGLTGAGPHTVCPTVTTAYCVTVTDSNGDSDSACATVTVKNPPVLSTSRTDATCGQCDGTATVTATGSSSFNYTWSGGHTTATITGLCAGSNTVTVTDANGCASTGSATVNNAGAPQITASGTDVLCNGQCTGTATVSITVQGTPPYSYTWSNGASATALSGLCAGVYGVTVTDNLGCVDIANINIADPPPIQLDETHANNPCYGDSSGAIDITAAGGYLPYTFNWSNGSSTDDINNLPAGTYLLTLTDNNGCQETISVTIAEPTDLQLATNSTTTTCGNADGSVSVTAAGGTPAYAYSWMPGGATIAAVTGLSAGTYSITVTDANGCAKTASENVTGSGMPSVQITGKTDVMCSGDCNGTATAQGSGGNPAYAYRWDDAGSQTAATATGLCAGTYTVCLTDNTGCEICADVTIAEPLPLVVSTTQQNESCSRSNGSVALTAAGGASPYAYSWSNGVTSAVNSGLSQGTYCVTATDNNGCTIDTCVGIGNIPGPSADFSPTDVCLGQPALLTYNSSGSIVTCSWDFGDGSGISNTCGNADHTYADTGTYTVRHCVSDAGGCTDCVTGVVIIHPVPVICFTDSLTGCVPLTQNFTNCSTLGNTCEWEIDGTTYGTCNPSHTFTVAGCYDISLTVTSPGGCKSTLTKPCYIEGYPWPRAGFEASPVEVTILDPTFNFTDKSTDAVSWLWVFGDGDSSVAQHPVHTYQDTGCYSVSLFITNQYGCTDEINSVVCVKDVTSIYVPNAFTPNGDGDNEWFTVKQYNFCEFEMYIFDRWGNEIYRTNLLKGWDGTANGGSEIVQEDVYVWLIRAVDCYGKTWQRVGHVTVIL